PEEVLGRGLAPAAVMAVKDDGRALREIREEALALLVERARSRDARDRALLGAADVEELEALASIHHRLELGRPDLLHPRRLVRARDLEAGAARAFDEIDRDAVRAPRARAVHEHRDAVRLDGDVAGLARAEEEPVLEASVDLEAELLTIALARVAE